MSDKERDYSTEDFDLIDLYITYNPNEAEFIKDMLDDNQIATFVRDMHPSQFPMSVGTHGQFRVVVEDGKAREAYDLILLAIEDEAITDEGKFIWEG